VKTFAAQHGDLVALPPTAPYSTDPGSPYYHENVEVATTVSNMTPENHWIAEFWSDDLTGMTFSPPARIFAIANQLISIEHMNLEETLHMYAILGIAINDAAVACWNSKYIYNTERPETFIRKYIDPDFSTIMGEATGNPGLNPAFPGYPSGHSTFAGVSWRIFEHFFGQEYEFTDHCHYGRTEFEGYPRTFTSWKQMAEENAYSRIPLGVHVRQDCVEGLRLGNLMGVRALDLDLAY
jgi:membrane-associated phospholipid phosphatase